MKRVLLLISFLPILGFSQIVINEFSSKGLYEYESSQTSDWIELINVSSNDLNISDYYLSDKTNNLLKWRLPEEIISPSQKILILCSGNNKSERIKNWSAIINASHQWRYFPGISEPDSLWNSNNYIDTSWNLGYGGFGFGDNDDSTIISGVNSFFLRKTFSVIDNNYVSSLILHAYYDDAFIAYLNGVEVARSYNINGYPPLYNDVAVFPIEVSIFSEEYERHVIDQTIIDSVILPGDNVLSIQVHNVSGSSDMSAMFFLHAGSNSDTTNYDSPANWFHEDTLFHTNFKLSHGETVVLSDTLGSIIDQKAIITNKHSMSEGRSSDGVGSWCLFINPSPGYSNDSVICYDGVTAPPTVSLPSGWYNNQQYIVINSSNNTNIYYTYNGDVPDTNDFQYTDTLWIDADIPNNCIADTNIYCPCTNVYEPVCGCDGIQYINSCYADCAGVDWQPCVPNDIPGDFLECSPPSNSRVLSVRVFSTDNLLPSTVIDRTYILNEDNFGLPVFSIITDSINLWGWNEGIYVLGPDASTPYFPRGANFFKSFSKRSRLEFFDKNQVKQAEEEFDLEIHGGWSRAFDQKSFRLDFKSVYSGDLEYPLFSQKPELEKFNNLNLRNGGHHFNVSRVQDGLMSHIAQHTNIDIMAYEPCILYLNGKYWGVYGLREKVDEKYVESNNSLTSDNIDMLNWRGPLVGTDKYFFEAYYDIINYSPDSSSFFGLFEQYFDVNNYIDYFIFQTYIQNKDWLLSNGKVNNIKLWRSEELDGKWRYVLYDTDYGMGVNFIEVPETDYIDIARENGTIHSRLFDQALKNDEFLCKFISRYTDLINTIFDTDSFAAVKDHLKYQIYDAMPNHLERWKTHSGFNMWEIQVNYIANYNAQRVSYALDNVQSQFNLSGKIVLDLNVLPNTSGKIMINTITPDTYPWNGSFFAQSCPINMSAIADSGYIFSHWQSHHVIGSQIYNDSIDISLSQDDTITANFRECTIHNLSTNLNSIDNYLFPVFDIGYGPYSFQWFFNDTIIAGAEDSLIYPSYTGMYSVSVTDKDGCEIVSPTVLIACSFFANLNSDLTQDIINNSLNINCNGGSPPYSYDWFYDNTILDWNDPIYFPLETGNYHVIITDSNGCQSFSDTIFTEDCGSVITSFLTQDSTTNNLNISCTGGTSPYSYKWFIDSIVVESLDKRSLDIYTSGAYYAIIEDINGCRSFTDTISNQRLEVNIFPNPTNRLMNIQFIRLQSEKYIISVVDLQMNILHYIELPKTDHNMSYTHTFNLDIDRTGLYFIRLESSKSHIAKRFIYTE